jgi:hypothetical protein
MNIIDQFKMFQDVNIDHIKAILLTFKIWLP